MLTEVPSQENGGISEDGLTWTLRLREDVTWSDGKPITAHDFKWTADFIMEHDISSYTDGYEPFTESIEVVDDYTIVWTTKQSDPGAQLARLQPDPAIARLGRDVHQGDPGVQELPEHGYSSAFKLVEWEPGEFWRLEAREDYYGGTPERSMRSCSACTSPRNRSSRR